MSEYFLKKRAVEINTFIIENGYSFKELSEKLKVSAHTVWRWANEPVKIKQKNLQSLKDLGCKI